MPRKATVKHPQKNIGSLVLLYIKYSTSGKLKHGSLAKVVEEVESSNLDIDVSSVHRYSKLWEKGRLCSCGKLDCLMAPQCWIY